MDVSRQLSVLGELNQVDRGLRALEEESIALPARGAELAAGLAACSTEVAAVESERAGKEAARRAAERELEDVEARARRSRDNAERVTNQAQYDASIRESEKLKALADELSDQALGLIEEVEALDLRLAAARRAEREAREARDTQATEAGARLPVVGSETARLRAERARVVAEVDAGVLARYERARAAMPLRAGVTVVKDDVCQSCRRTVPPQILNEATAFKAVHACPSCNRLVINVVWHSDGKTEPAGGV